MNSKERGAMKVHIDRARCAGHGRCYFTTPELFEPDEIGDGYVIGDGTVAPEHEVKARLAVANCPEHAITLDPPTGEERI